MANAVLTLNAGSSSLKFALFSIGERRLDLLAKGQIEGIGTAPHLIARNAKGVILTERRWVDQPDRNHEEFLSWLFEWADEHLAGDTLVAIGHRVVHGGIDFERPVLVGPDTLRRLGDLGSLAPLHQPHNVAAIEAAQAVRPDLPQVACFDTAFHHGHDDVVVRFALPKTWYDRGVRRYGFHGLSYEFVTGRLQSLDPLGASGRIVVAHLGNGASLCALRGGRSIDTTMGFTALDGLMMGSRCGAIDPGVVLYLQQQAGMTAQDVESLLYRESGLLGVSGISSDMRTLLASDEPAAKAAIDLFTFRIARETGALMSSLGGLDGFVFTAGIGENSAEVRAAVVRGLGWAGASLDHDANARDHERIDDPGSNVKIWVIPTDEEAMIAEHTLDVIDGR